MYDFERIFIQKPRSHNVRRPTKFIAPATVFIIVETSSTPAGRTEKKKGINFVKDHGKTKKKGRKKGNPTAGNIDSGPLPPLVVSLTNPACVSSL
jgi:hypothetical protein